MAIHCPIYDPVNCTWHIEIMGPNGPIKQPILSPLHYYHTMGVNPPVGAIFTDDDYLDFEDDLFDENHPPELMDLSFPPLTNVPGNPVPLQTPTSQMDSLLTIQPIPSTSSATPSLSSNPLYQSMYQPLKTEPASASGFLPMSPIIYFPLSTSIYQTPQAVGKSLNNLYGTYPINSVNGNKHLSNDLKEILSEDDDYDDEYMGYGKQLTWNDLQQV